MDINEFNKLKKTLKNKLSELLDNTEDSNKFLENNNDSNYSKLKNIVDTNLFQFNRIKDILIKMEEENIYLYEQHDIECIEREKCQNQ
mgnify:CR=1 FL=1